MPQNPFYEDNLRDEYPLVGAYAGQLTGLLAGAEVYVRASTGYRHSLHTVSLGGVVPINKDQAGAAGYPDSLAVLVLQSTVSGEKQQGLCFLSGEEFAATDVVAYDREQVGLWLNETDLNLQKAGSPNIWGSVIEGNLPLDSAIATNGVRLLPSRVIVSPFRSYRFGEATVVNELGEVSKPVIGCDHVVDPEAQNGEKLDTSCPPFSGPIRITGGIQANVQQDINQNAIIVTADGAGGEICGEDADPARFHRQSAYSNPCDEILRTVNGQGGPSLVFASGTATSVEPHPQLSRVVIRIGSPDLEICADGAEPVKTAHLPNNDQGIPCGFGGQGLPDHDEPDASTGFTNKQPTATTVPTSPPSSCLWRWELGRWLPVLSTCKSPSYCNVPADDGLFDSQEIRTPCLFPAVNLELPVVNGDLEDEFPLNGWDSTGDVQFFRTQQDEPSVLPSQLPMVELAPGGRIEQLGIRTSPERYVLQFESQVIDTSGELTVEMSAMGEGTVYVSQEITGQGSLSQVVLGPYDFVEAPTQLRFTNTGAGNVRLRFISLVRQ